MQQKTKRQHYVYKHYLDSWADDKEQVLVSDLSKGKSYCSNTKNVCVENGIYDVGELSPKDIIVFKEIFKEEAVHLIMFENREINSDVQLFSDSARLLNMVYPNELYRLVDTVLFIGKVKYFQKRRGADLNEYNLFDIEPIECTVENKLFIPFLNIISKGDYDKLNDDLEVLKILLLFSFQFSRTDNMLQRLNPKKLVQPENRAVLHLMCVLKQFELICKINYKISILKDMSNIDFITSDQPFILSRVVDEGKDAPLFYFPVTPKIAVSLLGYSGKKNIIDEIELHSPIDVEYYNNLIREQSVICIQRKST